MRYAIAIIIAALLPISNGGAKPSDSERDLPEIERCYQNVGAMAEAYGCLYQLMKRTRNTVDAAYARNLRAARNLDEYIRKNQGRLEALRGWPSFAQNVRVAQASWSRASDAQCLVEGNTIFGGSGNDPTNYACHIRHNKQRLSELQKSYQRLARTVAGTAKW